MTARAESKSGALYCRGEGQQESTAREITNTVQIKSLHDDFV